MGRTKSRVPVVVERKWIQDHGSQRQFHRVARLGLPILRRKCRQRGVRRRLLVVYARRLRQRGDPLLQFRWSALGRQPPLQRSVRPACPRLMIARKRAQSLDIQNTLYLIINGYITHANSHCRCENLKNTMSKNMSIEKKCVLLQKFSVEYVRGMIEH